MRMTKTSLSLALAAVLTASLGAQEQKPAGSSSAAKPAESSPPAASSSSSASTPATGAGERRAAMSPDERVKEMKEKLNLTDDQATKVKAVLEKNQEKMKELRADTTVSAEDKRTKYRESFRAVMEEVTPILTPDQQAKWKEEMAKRRAAGGTQQK
jgi:protein CpxP